MSDLKYTGELRKTPEGYVGHIADAWDWRLIIKAEIAEGDDGVKFFRITGTPGPVPECLLLPDEKQRNAKQ